MTEEQEKQEKQTDLSPFETVAAMLEAQMTPEILREHAVTSLKSMISQYQVQDIIQKKLQPELEAAVDQVLHSNDFRDDLKKRVAEQLLGLSDAAALQLVMALIKALGLTKSKGQS